MSTNNAPGQVFIIRHGEKLGDPKKDDDGGRHLSIKGSARAAFAWAIRCGTAAVELRRGYLCSETFCRTLS
jgi:phosphohistidine phosphatase SixA